MKDWFFYQEQGKTMGPLTAADLRARIREGRLRLFDMIYKEGEPGWRMALEHPDLRDEFKNMNTQQTKERPWVCLHRKNEQSFDFVTLGPYTEEEVREAIRGGKLSYADFIWRDEFTEWRRIGSLEEFNSRVRKEPGPRPEPSSAELLRSVVEQKRGRAEDVPPVILKPKEAAGRDLTKPPGHDDASEAATRIVTRPIARQSSEAPTRIVAKPKVPETDPDATRVLDPDATRIVKATDPDATRIVSQPLDPDATRIVTRASGGPPPPPANTASRIFRRSTETEDAEVEEQDEEGTQTRVRRRRRMMRVSTDWAIVGGLVLVLMLVIVFIARRQKKAPEPMPYQALEQLEPARGELTPPENPSLPPVNPPAAKPAPPPSAPSVDDVPPPVEAPDKPAVVEAPKAIDRPPTQLVLNVQGSNGTNASIEVRSNGSAEYPVFVQIIGLPGQVSEGASFYKYLRLKPTGNPAQPLDLGDIQLPQGRFVIRAETAKLEKEAVLNLGIGEAQFKQAVARERKATAAALWQERLRLFKLLQTLETNLMLAQTGKRFSTAGLDSLNVLKKTNGGNYILFDDWWEAKEIVQAAREATTPQLLDRARKLKERIASFSVWRSK